jgi:hypothetical protein
MQTEEILHHPTLDDIALDDQGRIVINDPLINEELMIAAAAKPKPPKETAGGPITNNGCTVNTVAGCGVKKLQ